MSLLQWLGRYILRLLPLAYMAFIWYLSSQSSNSVVVLGVHDSLIKESLHLVEFAILYGLLVLALLTWGELSDRGNRAALFISVAYAFLDEYHQSFIPSRSASGFDLVKDMAGVSVVWYVLRRTYFAKGYSLVSRFLHGITKQLAPAAEQEKEKQGKVK